MELLKYICPDSPNVWNQNGVSECFDDLVLGFGGNILTVVLVAVLGIINWHRNNSRNIHPSAKISLCILAAFGTCIACFDIVLLMKTRLSEQSTPFHEWLFRCSQFSVWVTILLVSRCENWLEILGNGILCFCWIIKLILLIPRLQIVFSSPEVVKWIKEICVAITDVGFGILINIIRIKASVNGNSSITELLLPYRQEIEEDHFGNLGIICKVWHLLTFKSIDLVMQHGASKQLDFETLLNLPADMDPSSCHNMLLRFWNDQRRSNFSHPSLFKTICSAYGWPYFCIGLLKVLNDCLGFAGPLLLNKLIHFLQQGSRHVNGYALALSLGFVSVLKSFLDTQYTYRLSQLRLKLRSSIMTLIYRKVILHHNSRNPNLE